MKKVSSGIALTETKAIIMATSMAAGFAAQKLPR
jgi:hypothetical protein